MKRKHVWEQIMQEVDNLNHSIEECCPEISAMDNNTTVAEMGDEMNELIEYRIKVLTESSKLVKNTPHY